MIIVQFIAQKHAPVVYYHLILTNLASVLLFSDIMMISIIVIPYSGKVWQGEIFGNFDESSVIHQTKIFQIITYN